MTEQEALQQLRSSSCFGAGVCESLPCACAGEIAARTSAVCRDGGWQPIETAPRDGTPIFVAVHTDIFGWVRGTSRWESHRGICGWVSRGITDPPGELGLGNPSLWQPLPAVPDRVGCVVNGEQQS